MPSSGGSGGGSFGGSSGAGSHGGGFSGGYHNYGHVGDPMRNHYRYDAIDKKKENRNIGCSVLTAVGFFIFAVIAVALLFEDNSYVSSSSPELGMVFSEYFSEEVTRSEPMENDAVFTGTYIEDKTENGKYISDPQELENSLEYFHNATGIIPYLYLTEEYPDDYFTDAAYDKYLELFSDEGHLLMYFVLGDDNYEFELMVGDDVFEYLGEERVDWTIRYNLDNMDTEIYEASYFGDVLADTMVYIADLIHPLADDVDVIDDEPDSDSVSVSEPFEDVDVNIGIIETTDPDSDSISVSQGYGRSVLMIILVGVAGAVVLALLIVAAKKRKRKNDFTDVEDYLRENGSSIGNDIYDDLNDKFDYHSDQ